MKAGWHGVVFLDDVDGAAIPLLETFLHVAQDSRTRVVITSRHGRGIPQAVGHCVVGLGYYERAERAHMFYNHVWHASHLHPEARWALMEPAAYGAVIDHPQFTPLLASHVARCGPAELDRATAPWSERLPERDERDVGIASLFTQLRGRAKRCSADGCL
jgi:hypothetical protein